MADTPQFEKERQAGRVVMRVPVEIRGTDADGQPLEESTFTGVVGALGAMIWASRRLQVGSEIELTNRFSQQTATFRVAWVKDQPEGKLWETGLESIKPLDDFWGVRFPPKPGHP
ncbi:MAG TPA: hypothetical protein VNY09_05685 [Candidatus Sulfotelmatobacter sp.]|nr:hypothetical protein [Candidatus Sulfotelmatobacter sp.]